MAVRALGHTGGLLEREQALASLESAAVDASAGQGSVIVVRGGAGLGKTRLLEELAGRDWGDGPRVLRARSIPLEREFAFGAVRQLFDPLVARASPAGRRRLLAGAAGLVESLFGAGAGPADATGFATLNGLWWLLSNVALERPVLLLLDDVQWADEGSVRWLSFLAPRIGELPALVVAAGRTDEPDAPSGWSALASSVDATVELDPLSREGTGEMLSRATSIKVLLRSSSSRATLRLVGTRSWSPSWRGS